MNINFRTRARKIKPPALITVPVEVRVSKTFGPNFIDMRGSSFDGSLAGTPVDNTYMLWLFLRYECCRSLQIIPGISGFTSLTGTLYSVLN